MKRLAVLAIMLPVLLCSCSAGEYTVTYVLPEGSVTESYGINTAPVLPESPSRENHAFVGWSYDALGNNMYLGGTPLDGDVTLYPVWSYDSDRVIGEIYSSEIKMCVSINAVGYNSLFGAVTDSDSMQGSGVICHDEPGYYYCVTNSHVTEVAESYGNSEYTVTDCYGNEFSAELIASDSKLDLALLRFRKGAKLLYAAPLSDKPAEVGDTVIALGAPDGVRNAVTFGSVIRLAPVAGQGAADKTDVTFSVIWHDAAMAHGSSGGALLNDSLELVGVNFAIAMDGSTGEYLYGFAIPASHIKAFLEESLAK